MTAAKACPQCGTALPADAPEGLCPKCLLQGGLGSGGASAAVGAGASTAAYWTSFKAPPPAELAPYFPQLEILELLGQGGMGAVYKARQPGLDRLVALKILPPEASRDMAFAERFTREAQALAKLNHPNIVGVYDFGRSGPLYYFCMEFVDGVNLRHTLRAGQLKPPEALRIVPQICDALQYAHEEGVVHRDIKPENVLLDKKGRVKIADFGLAKLLGCAPADYRLTGAQQVMGTPHYMAPEQVEKPLDVDHRADIYSLGVVFYEMLTGELPLGRFALPSEKVKVDVRLDEVVLRALAKDPERRYQHVSDIKTDMETALVPAYRLRAFGREYRSKRTLFGLPLIHIATGINPTTGERRVARGIIAYGDVAFGVVAVGGFATGGVAIGGAAVGVIAMGGLGIGLLLAIAGMALGGIAYGGGAVGVIALGGGAVGYYAYGGWVWAVHGLGSNAGDPAAVAFFRPWVDAWLFWAWLACMVVPPILIFFGYLIAGLSRNRARAGRRS
jgi:predicted Ser/Thr protein kinase